MVRVTEFGEVVRFDVARNILGKGRYWTTCYLVGGTLIDSGCAHAAAELVRELGGRKVSLVLHTHRHEDHIGGTGAVRRAHPAVQIAAHPETVTVLADPRLQRLHPYRRVMWGWPEPVPARALAPGEVVAAPPFRFAVVPTPGHSSDHLCFFEPERGWLFSGDLYVGGRDRALSADADVGAIVASLRRVAELPIARLFPGSARVPDDAAAALAGKIAHYEELGERVVTLRRQGRSVGAIARSVCGPPMQIELITLGHFSRRGLVRSFLRGA